LIVKVSFCNSEVGGSFIGFSRYRCVFAHIYCWALNYDETFQFLSYFVESHSTTKTLRGHLCCGPFRRISKGEHWIHYACVSTLWSQTAGLWLPFLVCLSIFVSQLYLIEHIVSTQPLVVTVSMFCSNV
jgi:hypothetical protein